MGCMGMKYYQHLLFDLDHTLWDFKRSATETLHELYDAYRLTRLGNFTAQQFCDTFEEVNYHLWGLYNRGEYDQQRLRSERFGLVLTRLGVEAHQEPEGLADEYLRICPTKPHMMPHTVATLDYLRQHYRLHILTNGFAEVQAIKLESAGLTDYFDQVVASDTTGHKKPHLPIFDYILEQVGADRRRCLMVGDNLKTDILGARNAGIDQVFYNPDCLKHEEEVTHEVACLSELRIFL